MAVKLERSGNVGEVNPFPVVVPDSIRAISPTLYDFLSELAVTAREQHTRHQQGDSMLSWELLTYSSKTQESTLGSIARFVHPELGLIMARYVKFASMNPAVAEGSPVGLVTSGKPWEVTNQLFQSNVGLVLGLGATYGVPENDSFGWVIVSGANIIEVSIDGPVVNGATLGWSATGELGVTTNRFARVVGDHSETIPVGKLLVESISTPTEVPESVDLSGINRQFARIENELTVQNGETRLTLDRVRGQLTETTAISTRTAEIFAERFLALDPERIAGEINDRIAVVAQYENLARVASENAASDAAATRTNFTATNEERRLAEIARTEAGTFVESSTLMRNEATLMRNEAMVQAEASALSAQEASVSETNAGVSANASEASKVQAATQAGFASGYASTAQGYRDQASLSASNAAGSEATATAASGTAVSARDAALLAGALLLPDVPVELTHYTTNVAQDPATAPTTAGLTIVNHTTFGKAIQNASSPNWYTRGVVPVVAGRTYEFIWKVMRPDTNASGFRPLIARLADNYALLGGDALYPAPQPTTANTVATYTWLVVCNDILAVTPTAKWLRPGNQNSSATQVLSTGLLSVRDVTSRQAAAGSAADALTYKNDASQAKIDAQGAASTATTQAGLASGSSVSAGNYANAALGYRDTASTHATNAGTSAATASAAATLAASAGSGFLNKNAFFADWPGASGTIPTNWVNWLSGNLNTKAAGFLSPNAFEQTTNTSNHYYGIATIMTPCTPGWYVAEGEVELVSGNLVGAGMYLEGYDGALAGLYTRTVNFQTEPEISGISPTSTIVPRRYRYAKLLDLTNSATRNFKLYAMSNFGGGNFGGAIDKVIRWYMVGLRPASEAEISAKTAIPTLQASVSTLQTTSVDLVDRVANADFEVVTAAGSSTAALRLNSRVGGGSAVSSVALEAQELQLWNSVAGSRVLAAKIAGGKSLWTGDMDVGGAIRVGTRRISVALQSFQVQAADGETISFGTDLVNIPSFQFSSVGLAVLGASQTYDIKATSVTSTGFVMYAKIITPGSPSNIAAVAGSNVGGTPPWQADKGNAADSVNGYYTFNVTANVTYYSGAIGEPYEGTIEFDCYVNAGSGWVFIGTWNESLVSGTRGVGQSVTKVEAATVVGQLYYASALGTHAGKEFGVLGVIGTITAFNGVSYTAAGTSSSTSSASPAGQKATVTVIPRNV